MTKREIVYSSRELNVKERIAAKDKGNSISVDKVVTPSKSLVLENIESFVVVHAVDVDETTGNVENEFSYVIISADSEKYYTGGVSIINQLIDYDTEIKAEELETGTEIPYGIEIFKKPSKKFEGKYYITCNII